ncbi:MAG TPA: pyruvate kinase alpha/beta domain-containing protein, partial [Verrucomicrobiae bacterium]|nr:pyruvate kinase alpha/beta domain-containing protein [Verrucomicrobiae bacterium]
DKIARRIERSGCANFQERAELTSPRQKMVKSAVTMADDLRAAALLVFTIRGHMARFAAWMRPRHSPIFAVCESWGVANGLALNYGVTPLVIPFNHDSPEYTVNTAIVALVKKGALHKGQTVVIISSISSGEEMVDAVMMRTIL